MGINSPDSSLYGFGDNKAVTTIEMFNAVGVATAEEARMTEGIGTGGFAFDIDGHRAAKCGESIEENIELGGAVVVSQGVDDGEVVVKDGDQTVSIQPTSLKLKGDVIVDIVPVAVENESVVHA